MDGCSRHVSMFCVERIVYHNVRISVFQCQYCGLLVPLPVRTPDCQYCRLLVQILAKNYFLTSLPFFVTNAVLFTGLIGKFYTKHISHFGLVSFLLNKQGFLKHFILYLGATCITDKCILIHSVNHHTHLSRMSKHCFYLYVSFI